MSVWVIEDWRSGKKTRRGEPLPPGGMPPTEVVTAVGPDSALDAFGCRNRDELARHLRRQRELGVLIADAGRLTKRVRLRDGRRRRCYVVRGTDLPCLRRPRESILYW